MCRETPKALRSGLSLRCSALLHLSSDWRWLQLKSTGKKRHQELLKRDSPWGNFRTDYPGSMSVFRWRKGRVISVRCAACDSAGVATLSTVRSTDGEQARLRVTLERITALPLKTSAALKVSKTARVSLRWEARVKVTSQDQTVMMTPCSSVRS